MISMISMIILVGLVYGYSTYGAPSEFGNESTTTCYIGGDDGIVNCTGNITGKWFRGLFNWTTLTNWITFDGSTLSFNETKHNKSVQDLSLNQTEADLIYLNLSGTNANQDMDINGYDIKTTTPTGLNMSLIDTGHWSLHIVDDSMVHSTNLSITASGGVVTADIDNEQLPGHNMSYIVDHITYRIIEDSTDTVTLTAGTATNPQTNYIYVDSDEQLKASTTPPTGEFAWAGIVEIADVSGDVVNFYAVQDEVPVLYELVVNNYERSWYDNPIYESGMSILFTETNMSTTSGLMRFALTSIPYLAKNVSSGTEYIWVDDPDTAYNSYTDLLSLAKYQDGGAIGINKFFNVMIFGLVENNGNNHYYTTVQDEPLTEYNSVSAAESDIGSKTNYQFPTRFARTGFRIARVVLKKTAGDNEIQTLSNGLTYKQLLDENLIVFGGTSSVALGLDEVVENNPNTDNNIISTANITADWFLGNLNWSYIQNTPAFSLITDVQTWISGNRTASEAALRTDIDGNWTDLETRKLNISDLSYTVDTSASVNCSTDEVFLGNGSCLASSSLGGGTNYYPTSVNLTAGAYNGSLVNGSDTGYVAGNSICDVEFSGHMCDQFEVTQWIAQGNLDVTGDSWVHAGGPKYVPADIPVNDCNGWTYAETTSYLGNYWHFDTSTGGDGRAINCGTELKLTCCVY